jgi:hypothetical protein
LNVREFLTKWGFDIEHEKLDKVESQLDAIKHRLDFLAAAEIVRGVIHLTEEFSKFAEELHVSATSAGITVEQFQKLAFAAKQNAVGQDEMAMSMARLSRHLYEARKGSAEAQLAFSQAGFSTQQIAGFKTGQDVLLALSDRFKNIQDPIQKQALAMQLMGRGSVNMVGFLSQGSAAIKGMGEEAGRLGIVLGERQVNDLVNLEHSFQKLWGTIKGIAGFIAAQFAPSMTYIINGTLKWYEANQKLLSHNIRKWAYEILYTLGYIFGSILKVTHAVINFANSHKTLFRFLEAFGALILGLAAVGFAVKKALGIFETFVQYFKYAKLLLTNPFSAALIAIGLLIVAVHDLWNAAHGKPTWIHQFLEWLGIADAVDNAFMKIFETIQALWDFGKGVLTNIGKLGFGGGLAESFAQLGKSDLFKNMAKFGFGGGIAANLGATPTAIGGVNTSTSINRSTAQVNAPITINANGADHQAVTKGVREGIRDHLDRVNRQASRSLQTRIAY